MNKIKKAMDEQLEHLVVDEAMKERVLSRIEPKPKRRKRFNFGFVARGFTLVSTFMIVVVLSINLFIHTDPNFTSSTIPFQFNPEWDMKLKGDLNNFNSITTDEPVPEEELEDGEDNINESE